MMWGAGSHSFGKGQWPWIVDVSLSEHWHQET